MLDDSYGKFRSFFLKKKLRMVYCSFAICKLAWNCLRFNRPILGSNLLLSFGFLFLVVVIFIPVRLGFARADFGLA